MSMLSYISEDSCNRYESLDPSSRPKCGSFSCVPRPGGGKECECSTLPIMPESGQYGDCKECLRNCNNSDIDVGGKIDIDDNIRKNEDDDHNSNRFVQGKHKSKDHLYWGIFSIVLTILIIIGIYYHLYDPIDKLQEY